MNAVEPRTKACLLMEKKGSPARGNHGPRAKACCVWGRWAASCAWMKCKGDGGRQSPRCDMSREKMGHSMPCGVGHGEPASGGRKGGWPDGVSGPSLWRFQEWIRDGKIRDGKTSKELFWARDGEVRITAIVMDREERTDSRVIQDLESIEMWGVREDKEYEMTVRELRREEDGWERVWTFFMGFRMPS